MQHKTLLLTFLSVAAFAVDCDNSEKAARFPGRGVCETDLPETGPSTD